VAYNGVQSRAKLSKTYQDLAQVNKKILAYQAQNGQYPATTSSSAAMGSSIATLTDANCTPSPTKTDQWVPGLDTALPQSDQTLRGVGNNTGCYTYSSNGTDYVLSGWNLLPTPTNGTSTYRRLGFREYGWFSAQYYICNHTAIGGGATYNVNNDYYKRSITYTSITNCNETPPAGA